MAALSGAALLDVLAELVEAMWAGRWGLAAGDLDEHFFAAAHAATAADTRAQLLRWAMADHGTTRDAAVLEVCGRASVSARALPRPGLL